MKLRYTLPALADLNSILGYIAAHSPQGARRVQERIEGIIGLLPTNPDLGVRTDDPTIRRLTTPPYPFLVFYEVAGMEIIITRSAMGLAIPWECRVPDSRPDDRITTRPHLSRKRKMNRDSYDLPLTTSSSRAAAFYRDGVDRVLSAWHGADAAFDRAIAEDPDFALAHIARARIHQLNAEGGEARSLAARARQLAATATTRERRHVEILAATIEGQPKLAITGAEQHLEEFPRDALVLGALLGAFGLYAFSGRTDHDAARLSICERNASHYGEDWWFLTYLGWSHIEAGNLTTGRDLTERAIALRPANANAAHSLAHALFEQGEGMAARKFLSGWLPAHEKASFLHGHLCWHSALTVLDDGDTDGALEIYRQQIGRDSGYPPLNVFTDRASLLWRLELAGSAGLKPHWQEVAAFGEKYFPKAGIHFADVHYALVAAATNDTSLQTRLAELEARDADGKLAPGRSAIDICRGIRAFAEGDNDAAIRFLEPAMSELVRIGGSHAQRELWEDTLIVACLRGGHADKAAKLISTRLERRPSARDEAWSRKAQEAARL